MQGRIDKYLLTINDKDIDAFGHVNNAAYLRMFEEARWDIVTKNGYGLEKILATQIGLVILELKINFIKELYAKDTIIIETQVVSFDAKIGRINQVMLRDAKPCCKAEIVFGIFSLTDRKLILPTAEWLAVFGLAAT